MPVAAQVVSRVSADISQLKRAYGEAREETNKQGSFFKQAFGSLLSTAGGMLAAAGISFGIQNIIGLTKDWVQSAIDAQQNQAALNRVLESTHDAVGLSAQQINDMVQQLKNLTGVDDDVILQGDNMLLTFTNIGKNVFPEASQAMLDMATAMNNGSLNGLDLKDTAIQLGKALNDPINGIDSLTRMGVTFTQQQKDQIRAMVEAGDTAGAQKLILAELEKEFGGAAQAAGNSDPFNKFKNALGDMGKTIGGILLPPLSALMDFLTPLVQQVQANLTPAFQHLGEWLGNVGQQVGELFAQFQGGTGLDFGAIFGGLADFGKGIDLSGIISSFKEFGQTVASNVLPIALQLADWFKKDMLPAIQQLMPHIVDFAHFITNNVVPAFMKIEGYAVQVGSTIAKLLIPVFEHIYPIVAKVAGWLLDMGQKALAFLLPKIQDAAKAVSQFATEMAARLQPFIEHLIGAIQTGADIIGKVWNFLWPWMSQVLKTVWDDISGVINIAWQFITGLFKIFGDILSGNWGQLWEDVKGLVMNVWGAVKDWISGVWDDLKGLWDIGIGYISDAWNGLWNGLAGIAQGAWDGVKGVIKGGINAVIDLINHMIDVANHVPGVSIPHLQHVNFAFGGEMPFSGMARVGDAGGPEYAFFPKGTQVVSASDAKRYMQQGAGMGGGGGPTFNFYGVYQPDPIAQAVGLAWRREMFLHGG